MNKKTVEPEEYRGSMYNPATDPESPEYQPPKDEAPTPAPTEKAEE